MEVHHHTHSARKKFRHYLFEFFMLFFAVFCGFMAEYFLEHTIEHQREEQFIQSMISDLKDDTARIEKVIHYNQKQLLAQDTLLNLIYTHPSHPDSIANMYRLFSKAALNYEMMVFTDRTMSQLKNSGGMRLIRKQSVSDSIMNYDAGIKGCEIQFRLVEDSWKDANTYAYQLFDLRKIMKRTDPVLGNIPYTFVSNNNEIFTNYSNRLLMFSGIIRGYTQNLITQKTAAERLIHFLEKQYGLD